MHQCVLVILVLICTGNNCINLIFSRGNVAIFYTGRVCIRFVRVMFALIFANVMFALFFAQVIFEIVLYN